MTKQEVDELKNILMELCESAIGAKKDPIKVAIAYQNMFNKLDAIKVEE